jgi:Dolichyl-phosphate-mannose-protein mannosyltransferase
VLVSAQSALPARSAVRFRDALLAALPGCVIAVTLLGFFLPKAFTIDDAVFLRGAQHASLNPTHPFDFDMCWDANGKPRRLSQYLPHAPLMPWLLMPVVRTESPEVFGHLLQIGLLVVGLIATTSIALRLGLSSTAAMFATTLMASSPAVLGMAATVMPDVAAMAFGVLAFERFLAWNQERQWWNAIAAVLCLALAPLARPQLALMVPTCAVLCLSQLSWARLTSEWRRIIPGLILLAVATGLYFGVVQVTKDPTPGVVFRANLVDFSLGHLGARALSFGCFLALTTPFVIGFFVLRKALPYWRIAATLIVCVVALLAMVIGKILLAVVAISLFAFYALGCALTKLLWNYRTGWALALALWAIFPFAVFAYMHMAAKYLVPSIPAYAIILVALVGHEALNRWVCAAVLSLSLLFSVVILSADKSAANMARVVADKWIPAADSNGNPAYFQGQWGLQWYAERHSARCFDPASEVPLPSGTVVIVDVMGAGEFPQKAFPRAHRIESISNHERMGLLLDAYHGAGFYSDKFGRLPWYWAPADTLRFELWKFE